MQIRLEKKEYKFDVIVPLEGLVDIAAEISRIEKVIQKTQGNLKQVSSKLSNERYLQNAPEDLVEADKDQVQLLTRQVQFLQAHLSRLSI